MRFFIFLGLLFSSPSFADELTIRSAVLDAAPFGHTHVFVDIHLDEPSRAVFIECFLTDAAGNVVDSTIEAIYDAEGTETAKMIFTNPSGGQNVRCDAQYR